MGSAAWAARRWVLSGGSSVSEIYIAKDGDMLDAIAWKYYGGAQSPATEYVLAANQGIADMGLKLSAGTRVILPDLPTPDAKKIIKIWGEE